MAAGKYRAAPHRTAPHRTYLPLTSPSITRHRPLPLLCTPVVTDYLLNLYTLDVRRSPCTVPTTTTITTATISCSCYLYILLLSPQQIILSTILRLASQHLLDYARALATSGKSMRTTTASTPPSGIRW
ncbi:hypothetical protein LZ31DRAFT_252119 [Colletotrichum somersetense]|nr:hypothetical protein LZ31DRAFT_252119 [Colletotrichum somersetense]